VARIYSGGGAAASVQEVARRWSSPVEVGRGVWKTGPESLEFALEVSGGLRYRAGRLRSPERVYFDLEPAVISADTPHLYLMAAGPVERVRISQFAAGVVRVVFDLKEDLSYQVLPDGTAFRVRLFDAEGGAAVALAPVAVPVAVPPPKSRFLVVVDPGHGGRDPGATGRRGTREKDVTLDIARRVKKELEAGGGIEVLLTRERDRHVPLARRTRIANEAEADLFVSIHVNAARNRRLNGVETWFLNATTNREWQEVADRENAIARVDAGRFSDLDLILNDLSRAYKYEESMALAHRLQEAALRRIRRNVGPTHDHGVKWAKFQVLVGARMPAALLEVGFISNARDEKRLRSAAFREELARAISEGIREYLAPIRLAASRRARTSLPKAN